MSVRMREYLPAVALRPFVARYWEGIYMGSPTATLGQKVLPTGFIELVLHLSVARCELKINSAWEESAPFALIGFWTSPYLLQFKDKVEVFSIRFKPEALYFIFEVPASEFINAPANLEEALGASFTTFCLQIEELKTFEERVQLANTYFLQRLAKAGNRLSYVQQAAELIRHQKGEITVDALSQEVCISTRQLEREFKNKLGISPKSYIRIARLHTVLQLINTRPALNLAQLSYLGGYADQAHFIRDFKQLTGELPSAYVSDAGKFIVP